MQATPAVLTARPARGLFIALALLFTLLSVVWLPSMLFEQQGAPVTTSQRLTTDRSSSAMIMPDPSGLPGAPATTRYEGVGNPLYVLGLVAVLGGALAVGLSKTTGYLVSVGGAIAGVWGLWLAHSEKALNGAVLGVTISLNVLILAYVLEAVERTTGRSLPGRRAIQTSSVVFSVLVQVVIASILFPSDPFVYDYNYAA